MDGWERWALLQAIGAHRKKCNQCKMAERLRFTGAKSLEILERRCDHGKTLMRPLMEAYDADYRESEIGMDGSRPDM